MNAFLARLRFQLERWILRGLHYRLAIAAILIGGVSLLAGALAFLLAPAEASLADAIWWAFLRLTDPGYLGDDEGTLRRTISTIVTVLGYVLFLGLLIAIMTQWLNEWVNRLERGVTPAPVTNHVLVLGWTHRTPGIVKTLLSTEGRLDRFLARHSRRELDIVIMAADVTESIRQELRDKLGPLWNDRRVLLRAGSPQRIEHLERVAFDRAAVMILPGADFSSERPGVVDAETIKTLLTVSNELSASDARHPLAVAALYDADRAPLARSAYVGETEALVVDEIFSQLIARCIEQPGIWTVFDELLQLGSGNAIYVRAFPELAGTTCAELQSRFPRAIVLGRMQPGAVHADLLPEPAARLTATDLLVLVARSYADCSCSSEAAALPDRGPAQPSTADSREHRLLVLGWSRKLPPLLADLNRLNRVSYRVTAAGLTRTEERRQSLLDYGRGADLDALELVQSNFLVADALAELQPAGYDAVIVIARERLDSGENADASTVTTQLVLQQLLADSEHHPHLLFEILDETNRPLFVDPRDDVLVSTQLASYMLSQVALRRELGAVFSELFGAGGPALALAPATDYVETGTGVTFGAVQQAAHARGEIAMGLRMPGAGRPGLLLNPDREQAWQLGDADELILLGRSAEPRG
jgi:hypothetical protein